MATASSTALCTSVLQTRTLPLGSGTCSVGSQPGWWSLGWGQSGGKVSYSQNSAPDSTEISPVPLPEGPQVSTVLSLVTHAADCSPPGPPDPEQSRGRAHRRPAFLRNEWVIPFKQLPVPRDRDKHLHSSQGTAMTVKPQNSREQPHRGGLQGAGSWLMLRGFRGDNSQSKSRVKR